MSLGLNFNINSVFDQLNRTISALSSGAPPPPPAPMGVNPLTNQVPPLNGNTIFPGDVDTMPFFDQGRTNGCGTTSLAMIMSYLGIPTTQANVDHEVRRSDIFSPPAQLVDYAREHGLEAEMYNNGTWNELKSYVDRGIPTQCVISADNSGDFATLHYVAVVGYGTDPTTGKDYVLLHDPNDPFNPVTGTAQTVVRMELDEFMSKWSKPPAGFENFFIAYGPNGTDLPWSRTDGLEGTLATASGVADIVNGWDRIVDPDSFGGFLRGTIQAPTGVVGTIAGGIFGGIELSGDWAHDKLDGIPVVSNLFNPVVDLWTGIGEVGADVVQTASEVADDAGELVEKLGNGDVGGAIGEVGEIAEDLGRGVVNTAADVGETVVNGVKDFFSGW